ncbi:trypsin beta [Lucilia sericata]|uniref:trypsin beta n=1 Tax=Lucilia sericata TaxID=13632 RepID=UPI0018A805D5|nr:trypsin beta [Lucilia sericata]
MLKCNGNSLTALIVLSLFVGLQGYVVPSAVDNNKDGRIVGGIETSIERFPYQVSVRLYSYILIHICGGSIYAPRVIITAAHCIKGRYASTILIVAGKSSIIDQEPALAVAKLIYNPGYNKKAHLNDVGLIILNEQLVYSPNIQPIPLAEHKLQAGSIATVTGWGQDDENAEYMQNHLQMVQLTIIDPEYCNSQYAAKSLTITEEMVCAGVEDFTKDSCQGDSGGPLVVDGKLVGIVSWGMGCARDGFPGVYSSVPYHTQWILDNAAEYL